MNRRSRPPPPLAGRLRVAALLLGLCAAASALADDLPRHPLLRGCEAPPGANCLSALETRALAGTAWRRDGLRLVPPTSSSDGWTDSEDGRLRHRYLGPLPGTELHLLARLDGDHAPQYLLSGSGAMPLPLDDLPWPAPGGRLMVVAAAARDGQAGGVTLLGRADGRWRVLWRFEASDGLGFSFRQWRTDAASVRLDWHCANGAAAGVTQLRDGPYGWDLVPSIPGCH